MTNLTPHEISLRTRSAIHQIIKKYGLDPEDTRKYGLIDRIIRGYLHASEGNARVVWPNELPDENLREYHVVAEVVSGRDIIRKGRLEHRERMKWRRPYRIGAKFVYDGEEKGQSIFLLEDIGSDYLFNMRGLPEKIAGHTCEDSLYNSGLKGIPTACYHACAVRCVAPVQLNRNAEEARLEGIKFIGEYSQIDDILIDVYRELEQHSLKSWQRLNILYACAEGELKVFKFGKDFLESVKTYLEAPSQ